MEKRARDSETERRENSFGRVAEDFIRMHLVGPDPTTPNQRTGLDTAHEIRLEYVSRFGDRPIDSITGRDIVTVIDAAKARGAPYRAHNLLGHARRLFNWAIARRVYGIDRSPCDRMVPSQVIGPKRPRDRILTDEELRALWNAAQKMDYPNGRLVQLLVLTGQRRGEIAKARWSEIDLPALLWRIPASQMKAGAAHTVPLTSDVVRILDGLPRFCEGDFLFSTTFGRVPISGFSKAKVRLDALIAAELKRPIEPFVVHDIRRTMRTGLSALPIPDLVRELVIAHSKPGLHKVYDQHAYLDEKRQALELWQARSNCCSSQPRVGTPRSRPVRRSPSMGNFTRIVMGVRTLILPSLSRGTRGSATRGCSASSVWMSPSLLTRRGRRFARIRGG